MTEKMLIGFKTSKKKGVTKGEGGGGKEPDQKGHHQTPKKELGVLENHPKEDKFLGKSCRRGLIVEKKKPSGGGGDGGPPNRRQTKGERKLRGNRKALGILGGGGENAEH